MHESRFTPRTADNVSYTLLKIAVHQLSRTARGEPTRGIDEGRPTNDGV